jgi:hypothetical protein
LQQFVSISDQNIKTFQYFCPFSISNGIFKGKFEWLFRGKSRLNTEWNTDVVGSSEHMFYYVFLQRDSVTV